MKSGLPFKMLVKSSEEVLRRQGHDFLKSDIGHTVELEVNGPLPFVVSIQRLEAIPHPNPLIGGLAPHKKRHFNNVRIILGAEGSKEPASRFVGDLLNSLPSEPWKGLGFVETFTSKSLWRRWAAGLESR